MLLRRYFCSHSLCKEPCLITLFVARLLKNIPQQVQSDPEHTMILAAHNTYKLLYQPPGILDLLCICLFVCSFIPPFSSHHSSWHPTFGEEG